MNSALSVGLPIRVSRRTRRIRTAIARLASRRQPELTREELAQLHEQRLLAERLLTEARASLYAARLF